MNKPALNKYVTLATCRNGRNEFEHPVVAQREKTSKWDQNNDAFQNKGRTVADMNLVEEESQRANENARNG